MGVTDEAAHGDRTQIPDAQIGPCLFLMAPRCGTLPLGHTGLMAVPSLSHFERLASLTGEVGHHEGVCENQ